jgi:phage-related protein
MATKSAGRVSIRVLPDSTGFKRDLQKSLERIEKQLKAKIRAELYLDRASLVNLKRQIESLVVKIKPAIELNVSLKELEELKAKIESIKPEVTVDLNTKAAAERIAALTRTRTVDIRANINRSALSLVEGFATRIRALAGLNLALDSLRAGAEFMNNIDRKAVEFAQTMSKVMGLVGTIGSTLATLTSIGGDALNVGKLSLFAPAFVAAAAIQIGVLVAVLKDMGTVLADLAPKFAAMQDRMSKRFWDVAAEPIRQLANEYLPTLSDRLSDTSEALGGLFKEFADTLRTEVGLERMNRMFERMNNAITDARPAVNRLSRAFIVLADWGSTYFGRFTAWINKLSDQFYNFISKAAEDGRLDKWMEDSIKATKDLARVAGGVAETLNGIYRAAKSAGAPSLNDFANGMERVADIVNSPRFQKNLDMLFQGMLELSRGVANGIKNLAPSIEAFIPTLTNILGRFGKIFETAFGFIGKFLENKDLQNGLSTFVGGIEKALGNLSGSADPAATSLGKLLDLMAGVLDMGTRLLNNVFTKLGPEFDKVIDAITPLMQPVENVANTVIDSLREILGALAEKVLPPLVRALENAAPALEGLLKKITPGVVKLVENLGNALSFLADSIKNVNDALGPLQEGNDLEWLGDLLFGGGEGGKFGSSGNPLQDMFGNWLNGIDWAGLGATIVDGWNRLWSGNIFGDQPGKFFREADEAMNKWWDETIGKWWDENIGKWITDAIKTISEEWKKLTDFIGNLFNPGGGIDGAVGGGGAGRRSIGGVIGLDNTDLSWFETLKATIATGMSGLGGAFALGGEGVKLAWDTFWSNLGQGFGTIWESLKLTASTKMTEIGTSLAVAGEGTKLMWDTFWTNLNTGFGTLWETIKATASTKMTEIGTTIATAGETVKTGWDTFWGGVGQVLQGKFDGFGETAARGMGTIDRNVAAGGAGVNNTWQGALGTQGSILSGKWGEFLSTVTTQGGSMAGNIGLLMTRIGAVWDAGWLVVRSMVAVAFERIVSSVTSGMASAVGAAGAGISNVVSTIATLPSRASGVLGNLSGTLFGSGASLVAGFASGMRNNMGLVTSAASAIAAAARAFFPNSPAKKGPFSGRGYTPWSGRALVKDFAGGMMDNMSMVKAAAEKVTGAAQIGNFDSFSDLETKMTITKKEVNLTVINPQAEPTSRSIERSSAAIRIAGDI